jgi:hypothetical protein
MARILKREFYVTLQFLLIALVAVIAAFFGMMPGGGDGEFAEAVNISEAWKNVAPYVKSFLSIFAMLSVLRLATIILVHSLKKPAG